MLTHVWLWSYIRLINDTDFYPIFRSELGEDASVTAVSEDPLENLGDLI